MSQPMYHPQKVNSCWISELFFCSKHKAWFYQEAIVFGILDLLRSNKKYLEVLNCFLSLDLAK
uniref:Uncharacterized protein n=1 Tax=Oryza brachyantha TaxID=4533 RepID=J3NE35_ORYBR